MNKMYFGCITLLICSLSTVHRNDKEKVQSTPPMPGPRAHHALVYDDKAKVVVLANGSSPVDEGKSIAFFNDTWVYDGKSWKQLNNGGDKRSGVSLSYDTKRNEVVSFGGFKDNKPLGDLRVFDGGDWKVRTEAPDLAVAEPGFVYDKNRDCFVAFGGSKERGQVSANTLEWKNGKWAHKNIPGPEARQAFAMIYDSKRKRTVLFGGMGDAGKRYNDTWEYDGKKWEKVDTAGPGGRLAMGYTYDSKRGLFIVFGGMGTTGNLGDTWCWNGNAWKQLAATGPSPRLMGYMAYDKKRDKVVLFGGRLKWPKDANDTWEWNGKEWEEVHTY